MSSYLSRTSWFQPNAADQAVYRAAGMYRDHEREQEQHPYTGTMAKVGATFATAEAVHRVYESPLTQKVTEKVVNAVPNVVKETVSAGAEKVQEAAGGVFTTMGDYFGYAQNLWSWGSWGFSWLPGSFKLVALGAGVYGVWYAYNAIRYPGGCYAAGSTNNLSSNVNVHLNLPPLQEGCKPEVVTKQHPDGSKDVHVGVVCQKTYAAQAPLRAANKITTAKEYHDRLSEYRQEIETNKIDLYDDTKAKVIELATKFDALEKVEYVEEGLTTTLSRAGSLLLKITKEVEAKEYHKKLKELVDGRLTLLQNEVKNHVVEQKAKFDELAVKKFDVRKLQYHLDRTKHVLDEAEKDIEEYTRSVAANMRLKRKRGSE